MPIQDIDGRTIYEGADLTRRDLSRASLRHRSFIGQNLFTTTLRGADLRHADFTRANLAYADLREATLRGAHFYGADLRFARFKGAILEWSSHDLISEILRQAVPSETDRWSIECLAFAGLIRVSSFLCWHSEPMLRGYAPRLTDWAISVLRPYAVGDDRAPAVLR